jgi:hypothetical protein
MPATIRVPVTLFVVAWACAAPAADAPEAVLRRAATFYASFDEQPQGEFGGGDQSLWTRYDHETEKGRHVFARGFDPECIRVVPDKGIQGGALEFRRALPRRGMLFFPAHGKLAYQKGGWGGAVSVWLKPSAQTPFCDPIYITQKKWNDGAIWLDHNHDRQGSVRLGAFPALPAGQKPSEPDDPHPSMLRLNERVLKADAWNHVLLSWANCDTGRNDGRIVLYIDGKRVGQIQDLDLRLDWDLDQTRIYLGFQYLGLLDELAVFNRPVTAAEAVLLHGRPGLLTALKK